MCFSGLFGGGNDAADEAKRARTEAEARERERQRKIAQGEAYIDQIFAQFDEPNAPGTVDLTPRRQPRHSDPIPAPQQPQAGDVSPGGDVWTDESLRIRELNNRAAEQRQRTQWLDARDPVTGGAYQPPMRPGAGADNPRQPRQPQPQPQDPGGNTQSGPSFYDTFAETYRDAYFPQLEHQYGQAQDKMAATLAERGVLESTPGAASMADLLGRYNTTRSQVESDAQGAVNDLRSRIQSAKTDLYGMNAVAANPEAAMAQAQAQATALAAPQSFSPLGQVFESFLHNAGAFNQANRNSANPMSFNSGPQLYNPSGSGSSSVVG